MNSSPIKGGMQPDFFQAALSAIHDPVYVFNKQYEFVYVNQAIQNYFAGIPLVGKNLTDLNYPEHLKDHLHKHIAGVFSTGQSIEDEIYYVTKAGDPGYFNFTFSLFKDANGEEFVIGVSHETTGRREAENALRESEKKYRNLFETMRQGYIENELIRDADGRSVDYRTIAVNPQFGRLTGVPADEAVGRTARELVGDLDPVWVETYDRIVRTGKAERFEREEPAFGRWFEVQAYPLTGDRFAILYDDITDRKQNEQRQAFLLKLSDAIRPLGDPVAIQQKAMQVLGEHLEVNRAFYGDLLADGDTLVIGPGYAHDTFPLEGQIKFSDVDTGLLNYYHNGQTFVLNNLYTDTGLSEHAKTKFESIQVRAAMAAPLMKNGRVQAILSIHQTTPRVWTTSEIALLEETAERTWAAVEQANAEKALRNSELTRRMALEAFNIGMTVWYPQEDYTDSDDRFFKLFGLEKDGVINRETALNQLLHPDDREYYGNLVIKALDPAGDGSLYAEYRVIYPDGSIHWLATTGQTIFEGQPPVPVRMYGIVQEITVRKEAENNARRAEAALRQSEEQRNLALDATQVGTFIWHVQEDRGEPDARMLALFNQPPDGTLTLREAMASMIHPDDAPRYAAAVAEAARPDGSRELREDIRVRRADGGWHWVAITAKITFDEAGTPLRMAGTGLDVTNRKRAEEVLRESEERQAFLLKLSDAIKPLTDPVAIQAEASRIYGEFLKVERVAYAEMINEGFVIHRDYTNGVPSIAGVYPKNFFGERVQGAYTDAGVYFENDIQANPEISTEAKQNFKDTQIGAYVGATLYKKGAIQAGFAAHSIKPRQWTELERELAQEVTERTWAAVERARAEKALRESEKRFQSIVNLVPDLLWDSEPDGSTNWYNQRWLEYTGQSFEQAIGWGWTDAIHPDDREGSARRYSEAVEAGRQLQQEHRIRRHDGEYRWFVVNASPVKDSNGRVVKMYNAATDIHDRKLSEESFREAELRYRARLENEVKVQTLELNQNRVLLQATLDSNPEMIQVFKAVRDKRGKIIDFIWILNNASSELIYGDVIGKSLLENNPGVKDEGIFKKFIEVIESGIPQQYERHYVHEQFDGWFYQSVVKMGDGVATNTANITERKQAEEKLREMEAGQQREIVRATLIAIEEERQRIAESLHNGLGQLLYGIKISIGNLSQDIAQQVFEENKTYTGKLLSDAISESRRISHELTPATLEMFGLKTAVEDICEQLEDSIHFVCRIKGPYKKLEKYLELAVYRIVQELMTNVVKHAGAKKATTEVMIDMQEISIKVSDNGRGMSAIKEQKPGIGLASIRSKVNLLNGQMDIYSDTTGTRVEIVIPMQKPVSGS
jgi:PAS domain S-box-containing protein